MKLRNLTLLLVCLALLAGCGGQAATPAPSPQSSPAESPAPGLPDPQIVDMALAHIRQTVEMYRSQQNGYGFEITDTVLTGLKSRAGATTRGGTQIEVYEMTYRLKPEDASKVPLAGGMALDEEGWLLQAGSMGNPCLVVSRNGDTYALLGETWTGEVELEGGWIGRLGALLMNWGHERESSDLLETGRLLLTASILGRASQALSPFTGQAPTEEDPYTDENGQVWHQLSGYEKQGDLRMDDQLLSQLYMAFPKSTADAFFARWVYTPDSLLLEREGRLYVRADAARRLGWDYTVDLSTLSVVESQSGEGYLELTASGTGHGGHLTWRFNLLEEEGRWLPYRYFTLCAEGWDAPAEFAVLTGDEWFGLDSGAAPEALGEALRGDYDYNNTYGDGGKWRWEYYDGATAIRYEGGDGTLNGVVTLEVFHPGLPDWRGVEVGDSLEEVMAVYPEAIQYRTEGGGFGLDYNPSPDYPGRFASFYFNQDRTLSSFLLKYAFD